MSVKALNIMKTAQSSGDRAQSFLETIKRNIQRDIIDVLITQKEKLEDELISLQDFSLEIDLNKGQTPITREEAELRFKRMIDCEYQLVLVNLELKTKQASFDSYFTGE